MSKRNINVLNLKNNFKTDKHINSIYKTFSSNLNFVKKNSLMIGVSGGPDSLALVALSRYFQFDKKNKVYYVLVNHKIRDNSSQEANAVKRLLKKFNISLIILKNNQKINSNIQGKAREIRYKLFSEFCKKKKIKYILTGHHSDDQIETFLIRLSRGSGVQGLSSMMKVSKYNKDVKIIRPLLNFKKKQLVMISQKVFGKIFIDPSNKDTKYLRTKVRRLNKMLEKSGIKNEQILKSIENLASTNETINNYVNKIYKQCVKSNKKIVKIKYRFIKNETNEVQIKVLSKVFKEFTKSYYPPRSKKIINLLHMLNNSTQKKFTLAGCILLKEGSNLRVEREI